VTACRGPLGQVTPTVVTRSWLGLRRGDGREEPGAAGWNCTAATGGSGWAQLVLRQATFAPNRARVPAPH